MCSDISGFGLLCRSWGQGACGIVYCLSRANTEEVAYYLNVSILCESCLNGPCSAAGHQLEFTRLLLNHCAASRQAGFETCKEQDATACVR